jgi:transcription antitermination factor NusG
VNWDWIVLRTKSNCEKVAVSALEQKSISCFLPTRKVAKPASSKTSEARQILFPGYLFTRPSPSQYFEMRYVPGTCGVVSFDSRPATISAEEIERIRKLTLNSQSLEKHPDLHVGEKVCVVKGPLAGVKGDFVRLKGVHRLIVNVDILGQSVSIEIERDCLKPL